MDYVVTDKKSAHVSKILVKLGIETYYEFNFRITLLSASDHFIEEFDRFLERAKRERERHTHSPHVFEDQVEINRELGVIETVFRCRYCLRHIELKDSKWVPVNE